MLGENEEVNEEGSFSTAQISHRIAIVLAGATVNIVFAIVVYFLLMTISGVNSSTIIQQIIPEYAMEDTVLQVGDKILMINGHKTRIKSNVDNILSNSNGEKLNILVERNGESVALEVEPIGIEYNGKIRYILGVAVERAQVNLKNNLYYGFWETADFLETTKDGLVMLFTGQAKVEQMTGPVGISEMVVNTSGVYEFVYLLCVISLSLGVTNLLPIPALDGGKIVLLIIEAIRHKKMSEEMELKIQSIGFTFLILLSLYVSFNDISKLF